MALVRSRGVVVAAILCSTATANATSKWVKQEAAAPRTQRVAVWHADLDGDGKRDTITELCIDPERGNEIKGRYLFELSNGDRQYRVRFVDWFWGNSCSGHRTFSHVVGNTFVHETQFTHAMAQTFLGVRDGDVVVLAASEHSHKVCEYGEDEWVDWRTLTYLRKRVTSWRTDPKRDACPPQHIDVSRESLFVLADDEPAPVRLTHVGSTTRVDVVVKQVARKKLRIELQVDDDQFVESGDRQRAAVAAADHFTIWVGHHELLVARDHDGHWFAVDDKGIAIRGDDNGNALSIETPLAWAGIDPTEARWAGGRVGSLVVAYTDVDASGASRARLSSARIPKKGTPRGMLVRLAHGGRWPTRAEYLEDREVQ